MISLDVELGNCMYQRNGVKREEKCITKSTAHQLPLLRRLAIDLANDFPK